MKPSLESRLSAVGCVALLLGVGTLVRLTFTTHWRYAIGAAGLLVAWVAVMQLLRYRDLRRERSALCRIFGTAGIRPPQYKTGGSYGFPTFTLTFGSATEMKQAEEAGCIDAVKNWLQTTYGHIGGEKNPFDVERALYVTSEEQR